MIDIIIPAYNAHNTISFTLSSIAYQFNKDLINVYIINDGSDYDYSKIVSIYENSLNIKELYLNKNCGPGYARQYGIDNSNGEYIIFIDSDDTFYNCFSVYELFNYISTTKSDFVMSIVASEIDNEFIYQIHETGDLHGKIYKRKFLVDNNISFNNSYTSEDNSFNQLLLLHNPRVNCVKIITYLYRENKKSLTRKEENDFLLLKDYCDNMVWAVEQVLGNAKIDIKKIANLLYFSYIYIYYNSINFDDEKLICFKKINNLYKNYCGILSNDEKNIIMNKKLQNILMINEKLQNSKKIIIPNYSFEEFMRKIENL